jgi:alkanesulfonate monooxygenase SsuD/methylene tetrahydromethanopterin reductase-like flavin-dependent oxidoreductase (luciferase family)
MELSGEKALRHEAAGFEYLFVPDHLGLSNHSPLWRPCTRPQTDCWSARLS